jgi:DNA-binding NtrC family response regulator
MEHPRVLVVDDEASVRESLRMVLKGRAHVTTVADGSAALAELANGSYHVALLDLVMPGMDGLELLERGQALEDPPQFILLTATKTVKTAVRAMKLGAFDYITKPFDVDELQVIVDRAADSGAMQRELETLRSEVGQRYELDNVIGTSPAMQKVLKIVRRVAPLRSTVLLTGESGTGKEVIARAIHYNSPRRDQPLVALNCAAIPQNLLEAELFGHERGAFTDAHARKIGHFERAHGGTIFLDEIGDMPPATQATLLRILESGQFTRVGGEESIEVDVRVVAATNRDLDKGMEDGSFRSDLYFRLNVVAIPLPPLRERREDLPLLIRHFLEKKSRAAGIAMRSFTPEALDRMMSYDWPGNVRELENAVERALALSDRDALDVDDLPGKVAAGANGTASPLELPVSAGSTSHGPARTMSDQVDALERQLILSALHRADYNQTRAAEDLGTTRRILKYKMDKLGIAESPGEESRMSAGA